LRRNLLSQMGIASTGRFAAPSRNDVRMVSNSLYPIFLK
jgi:hypothetical protein